ncbi:MAG: FAD-dependent oxidoreductase, partial [Chloroflexi bacterium]|nr:FAD-dependent oxidoreductase [Chloroflexota bacterium]
MTYDVIIIGAGPAGSTAARECAARGLSVLLLDK